MTTNNGFYGRPLHMGLQLVTPPASEPVTLAEAKKQCRVEADDTYDDDFIMGLISAARHLAEVEVRQQFITATWRMTLDQFPLWMPATTWIGSVITLPRPPLQSVTSIIYYDQSGDPHTVTTDKYTVDTVSMPGRIAPTRCQPWPVVQATANAVAIEFVAGYGDAADVPEAAKLAIKMTVAHLYRNRETIVEGSYNELPRAAEALLASISHGHYS